MSLLAVYGFPVLEDTPGRTDGGGGVKADLPQSETGPLLALSAGMGVGGVAHARAEVILTGGFGAGVMRHASSSSFGEGEEATKAAAAVVAIPGPKAEPSIRFADSSDDDFDVCAKHAPRGLLAVAAVGGFSAAAGAIAAPDAVTARGPGGSSMGGGRCRPPPRSSSSSRCDG